MTVTLQITKPVQMSRLASELNAAGFIHLSYSEPPDVVTVFDTIDTTGVTAVYDAHTYTPTAEELAAKAALAAQITAQVSAVRDYGTLADWARTGTAADAETFILGQVWNGQSITQVNTWIDTNITNITTANVAQINARLDFIRQALKLAASAIINMRGLFILTSKLLIYIRDLVLRFRQ